jgi:SAM-dependent methyltransferase
VAETFWEEVAETRWGSYLTARERAALEQACARLRPGLAVELGCEGGRWSRLLAERGWRLICTEVDAETLAICQRRLPEATCVLVDGREERIPAAAGSARLLVAIEVPPVVERASFPAEAARVLEPGGLLVCTYHNPRSLRGIVYRLAARRRPYYSGRPYSAFRAALRRAGLEVVAEEGLAWLPFSRSSNSRLVPALTSLEAKVGLRSRARASPLVVLTAQRAPVRA